MSQNHYDCWCGFFSGLGISRNSQIDSEFIIRLDATIKMYFLGRKHHRDHTSVERLEALLEPKGRALGLVWIAVGRDAGVVR